MACNRCEPRGAASSSGSTASSTTAGPSACSSHPSYSTSPTPSSCQMVKSVAVLMLALDRLRPAPGKRSLALCPDVSQCERLAALLEETDSIGGLCTGGGLPAPVFPVCFSFRDSLPLPL
jgi:hypothetical protein